NGWEKYKAESDAFRAQYLAAHPEVSPEELQKKFEAARKGLEAFLDNEAGRRTATQAEQPARHSHDFRPVVWFRTGHSFTGNQAACVKILWKAWQNGTPDVGDLKVLETAGTASDRLDLLFRNHPAWGTMIQKGGTKGTHRLVQPNG